MQLNNVDEATRMCQEIRMLKSDDLITEEEAKAAVKRVPFYKEVLGAQNN